MKTEEAMIEQLRANTKYETEIETKDGSLVLFHNEPMSDADKTLFKSYTKKEVEALLCPPDKFNSYQY